MQIMAVYIVVSDLMAITKLINVHEKGTARKTEPDPLNNIINENKVEYISLLRLAITGEKAFVVPITFFSYF